jgi:peptidoglycan hydrolase-like protein with peptidoglycan-binding domain
MYVLSDLAGISTAKLKIMFLQAGLKLAGHDPGPIDGISGDKTKGALRALKNYLNRHGMSVSEAQTSQWAVMGVQNALKAFGMDPGEIDGVVGTKSKDALSRYMQSKGVSDEGAALDQIATSQAGAFAAAIGAAAITIKTTGGEPRTAPDDSWLTKYQWHLVGGGALLLWLVSMIWIATRE